MEIEQINGFKGKTGKIKSKGPLPTGSVKGNIFKGEGKHNQIQQRIKLSNSKNVNKISINIMLNIKAKAKTTSGYRQTQSTTQSQRHISSHMVTHKINTGGKVLYISQMPPTQIIHMNLDSRV
eukprot:4207134-Amphidinium_carterae.1